jgi:HAD superfamily hydrolase (TIGR01549 family)
LLKAVTFDFWGPLYKPTFAGEERLRLLEHMLAEHGQPRERPDLEKAASRAWQLLDAAWRRERRSPGARAGLDNIAASLGSAIPDIAMDSLAQAIEKVYLSTADPIVVPGVTQVLPELAAEHEIGLISDVGLSPGSVLRQVLARDGLLCHFDAFCFSDEVGVTKPHPRMFRCALEQLAVNPWQTAHVRDLPETDLAGAREARMRTILFLGESDRQDGLDLADGAFERYEQLLPLLRSLD